MKFEESYNLVIGMWPNEIDISNIKFHSNGGATIPELIKVHDRVEEQCINLGKEVLSMDWALFQYFHSKAKKLHKSNIFTLNKEQVNVIKLKELYIENIN